MLGGPLGAPWGSFGGPMVLLGALGGLWGAPWNLWGLLGVLLGPLGGPLGPPPKSRLIQADLNPGKPWSRGGGRGRGKPLPLRIEGLFPRVLNAQLDT